MFLQTHVPLTAGCNVCIYDVCINSVIILFVVCSLLFYLFIYVYTIKHLLPSPERYHIILSSYPLGKRENRKPGDSVNTYTEEGIENNVHYAQ